MSYFIFNETNSNDLGMIVRKPIIRPTWGNEYAEMALAGGTRKVMQQSKYYENSSITIDTYVHDASPEKIREIYSKLKGEGKLWISTAPDEILDAIMRPLVPEPVALLSAEIPINVTCLPFAYAVSPTSVVLTSATDYMEVVNAGTVFSAPEIRFVPTAATVTITTNGKDFEISALTEQVTNGYTVVVDSDLNVVYYLKNGQAIDITQKSKYDLPLLHTGQNYIKHNGNVGSMSINLRERWL